MACGSKMFTLAKLVDAMELRPYTIVFACRQCSQTIKKQLALPASIYRIPVHENV